MHERGARVVAGSFGNELSEPTWGMCEHVRRAFVWVLLLAGLAIAVGSMMAYDGIRLLSGVILGIAIGVGAFLEGWRVSRCWQAWQFARQVKQAARCAYSYEQNFEQITMFIKHAGQPNSGMEVWLRESPSDEPYVCFPRARAVIGSTSQFELGPLMVITGCGVVAERY